MKTAFDLSKITNVIPCCLLAGPYGLVITGFLQVIEALLFVVTFPKSKLIYLYFALVALFFFIWNGNIFGWQIILPIFLIVYLSLTIHTKKI